MIGLEEIGKIHWGVNETLGNNLWDIFNHIAVFTGWGTMGMVVGLHEKII